ncbi:MAG TPA: hypothetical protein VIH68_02250, partial [Bacteroidota bacterium]
MLTTRVCRACFILLLALVVGGVLLPPGIVNAQISEKLSAVNTGTAKEGEPLTITAELVQSGVVSKLTLAYRSYGQSEYRMSDMALTGATATATIPGDYVTPPLIEYYLVLEIADGTMETHPMENPQDSPLQATVEGVSPRDQEVVILSPEKGQQVSLGDFVVSVSLIRASGEVDK